MPWYAVLVVDLTRDCLKSKADLNDLLPVRRHLPNFLQSWYDFQDFSYFLWFVMHVSLCRDFLVENS